jgi:glycosyltransferase involved in cell wall biosynthesis
MRIAIWHNLPSGGAKRSLYWEVRELQRRGHYVESWCPSSADQSYLPLGELVHEHVLPLAIPPLRQDPLGRLRRPYDYLVARLRAMDAHCQQAAAQINAGGFDILFGQGCTFFRTTAISRLVALPKTIYLGEPYRPLYEAMPDLPWAAPASWGPGWWAPDRLRANMRDALRLAGLRVQVREEVRNARAWDSVLANSLFSRESFLRAYGVSARVRYPGIDTELFVDQARPREQLVVGLGALVPEKNPELIIRAVGQMPTPRPRLVWVGNVGQAEYIERLRRLAAEYELAFEPRVRVTDTELVELLNRATAMVYAPRLEPFGLAPLEANACATPVVAVAEGGVRETILHEQNGLLVEHDARAMGQALTALFANAAFARELGQHALALVRERWSLPASIDRLEQRFAEVLEQRREHEAVPRP